MFELENKINQFNPVSLEEMDKVKLFNRVDTKFICSVFKLPVILKDLANEYKVLDIDNQRIMPYLTRYYDTADFKMYYEHQNGKLNRYKIREREYINSELNFLEIKFKNNKSRTLKSRINKAKGTFLFTNDEIEFLDTKTPFSSDELELKLYNSFRRFTLTNQVERVTVDFNLEFKRKSDVRGYLVPFLAVIEVKQSKFSVNSRVVKILREQRIQPCSFSKYCIGSTLVYPELKSNRFKSKLLLINKLTA